MGRSAPGCLALSVLRLSEFATHRCASRLLCKFTTINAARSAFINPGQAVWPERVPLDLVTAQFSKPPIDSDNCFVGGPALNFFGSRICLWLYIVLQIENSEEVSKDQEAQNESALVTAAQRANSGTTSRIHT